MKASKIISCCTAIGMLFSSLPNIVTADAVSTNANILINEVCTQNKACLTDSYGETSDWIELYNPTDKAVSLAGYSISKNPEKPKTWVFPDDAVIGSGKYLVIIASKNASVDGEYHMGYNLDKNGETLTLKAPDGSVVHELIVPTLGEDMTYGITYTGAYEIMNATPREKNELTVSAPEFSKPSGFYDKEFQLSLSAYEGDTIYYTTDGSDPLTSKTAQVYKSSITVKDRSAEPNLYRIYGEKQGDPQSICVGMDYKAPCVSVDKAMVVRAAAKTANGESSAVVQQTYFVTDGQLADYSDMTVVSLVTEPDNLFSPDYGIYVIGNKWKWNVSTAWDVDTDTNNMRNYHQKGKAWEREAAMTIFDGGKKIVEQNMGIRIKGSSTRNGVLKSFNLYARSEYGASKVDYPLFADNTDVNGDVIDEYDSLSLRGGGGFRDAFVNKLMEDRDIAMTAQRPCILFINGEYWGFYQLTEKFSDTYIKSHYGASKSNVAMVKNSKLEEGEDNDLSEFNSLVRKYASLDLSKTANYEEACRYFDEDSLIEHYAAGIYYGVWDWPNYNYGAWKDKGVDSDGRWHFMAFDFDHSLGRVYETVNQKIYTVDFFSRIKSNGNGGYIPTCLFLSMLDNSDFCNKFVKAIKEYAEKDSLSIFNDMKNDIFDEIVKSEYILWSSGYSSSKDPENACRADVQKVMDDIEEYLRNRKTYVYQEMKKHLGIDPDKLDIPPVTTTTTTTTTKASTTTTSSKNSTTTKTSTTLTSSKTTTSITTVTTTKPVIPDDPDESWDYNVADLVKLSKYLLGNGELDDWKKYDLCKDSVLDAFDLCMLRRKLIEDICENQPNMLSNLSWSYYVDSGDGADASFKNASGGGFTANIAKTGTEEWSIQVKYGGLKIEKGAVYQVSFDYTATQDVRIKANVMMASGDYTNYGCFKANADSTVRHFSSIFVMEKPTDKNARLSFDLGGKGTAPYNVTISNVRLVKIQ